MARPERPRKSSRRDFLKIAAAGAAGATVAPAWRPAKLRAKPAQITFLRESSYVKEFDDHFKNILIPRYQKETGIKVNYEIVAAGGSAVPRLVSIVESKAPVDVAWLQLEWLYRDGLLDVSDIAEEVGRQGGGWYPAVKDLSIWEGKWKSVPFGNIGQVMVYRRDWFD
ncbi:MAG TPA: extracellular solute-binding protein, partial [Candidatus Bathyarchaeia archaeon]|nr:extracellular solute-binding protein [Candidatus Bathyarchaeia archaeon]